MEFLLIATTHFLALLSPGPDFFLIIQASLRLPLRYGIAICAGIAAANAVYLLSALLGLEAIRQMSWLMILLKYIGSFYLIFLGIMLLKTPRRTLDCQPPRSLLQSHHLGRQFLLGFMSGILNPKNVIFYLSLFTVMVSAQTGFATRTFYALWMTSMVFFWDCLIVTLVGRQRVKSWLGPGVFYVEKFSGTMLMLLGIGLPFA